MTPLPDEIYKVVRLMTNTQKEHVIELIAALRGGKYKQGKGMLRPTKDTWCPLGVACDISGLSRWRRGIGVLKYRYGKDVEDVGALLPDSVAVHYGFNYEDGHHQIEGEPFALTDMNDDDDGSTFQEIADRIEYCLNHPETEMFV